MLFIIINEVRSAKQPYPTNIDKIILVLIIFEYFIHVVAGFQKYFLEFHKEIDDLSKYKWENIEVTIL